MSLQGPFQTRADMDSSSWPNNRMRGKFIFHILPVLCAVDKFIDNGLYFVTTAVPIQVMLLPLIISLAS